jgi:hypothetical protein
VGGEGLSGGDLGVVHMNPPSHAHAPGEGAMHMHEQSDERERAGQHRCGRVTLSSQLRLCGVSVITAEGQGARIRGHCGGSAQGQVCEEAARWCPRLCRTDAFSVQLWLRACNTCTRW